MTKLKAKQYFIDLYVKHIKQEDIPEWAECLATDRDGEICVYSIVDEMFFNGSSWSSIVAQTYRSLLSLGDYQTSIEESLITIEELLPHYSSQSKPITQEKEAVQDKVEFEAVSGDQSLFDLVGAKDDDLYIVRNAKMSGIYAANQELMDKHHYWQKGKVLASRKVKEKPYIPEVGHTYKLSTEQGVTFTCVFVDIDGDVWSTCNGTMFTHYIDYLSRESVKFIRIS